MRKVLIGNGYRLSVPVCPKGAGQSSSRRRHKTDKERVFSEKRVRSRQLNLQFPGVGAAVADSPDLKLRGCPVEYKTGAPGNTAVAHPVPGFRFQTVLPFCFDDQVLAGADHAPAAACEGVVRTPEISRQGPDPDSVQAAARVLRNGDPYRYGIFIKTRLLPITGPGREKPGFGNTAVDCIGNGCFQ